MIDGIAWLVREGESFKDAIQQATTRYKEKFRCWPDHIMVGPGISVSVEGLTVVEDARIGRSYTFLLYHNLANIKEESEK